MIYLNMKKMKVTKPIMYVHCDLNFLKENMYVFMKKKKRLTLFTSKHCHYYFWMELQALFIFLLFV